MFSTDFSSTITQSSTSRSSLNPLLKANPVILNRHIHLPQHLQPALAQLMRQTHFIHRLQQPRPERPVDHVRRIHNLPPHPSIVSPNPMPLFLFCSLLFFVSSCLTANSSTPASHPSESLARILPVMSSDVTPSLCAAKFGMIRCRKIGTATAATSSQLTWYCPLQHRPRLGRHDQVQARPRPGAPRQPLLAEVQSLRRLGPRHPHQLLGIAYTCSATGIRRTVCCSVRISSAGQHRLSACPPCTPSPSS